MYFKAKSIVQGDWTQSSTHALRTNLLNVCSLKNVFARQKCMGDTNDRSAIHIFQFTDMTHLAGRSLSDQITSMTHLMS